MSSAPVVFNGKFLSARPTGVHRVAGELIVHLDRLLEQRPRETDRRWTLACPSDAKTPLPLGVIERRQVGLLTWQPWEQIDLPRFAVGATLVNLCNLAPLAHPRSITLIHDAQVFLSSGSYSRAFRTWYRFALPRIGARAARIVTISEYSRARLAEFGVAPSEHIAVVPNGVDHLTDVVADPSVLSRVGASSGRYVLAAANAQVHKNVAVLFNLMRDGEFGDGLQLVLVGADGADAFTSAGNPPPAGVVFTGRVSDGELRALYEHALCLAFPSTTEGFGLPPLEAMSVGCPTIVAPCGALPEVCGQAAFYAAPDDPRAWGEAISRIACDAQVREALRGEGRAQAARFRWEDSARRLLKIIEEVA